MQPGVLASLALSATGHDIAGNPTASAAQATLLIDGEPPTVTSITTNRLSYSREAGYEYATVSFDSSSTNLSRSAMSLCLS